MYTRQNWHRRWRKHGIYHFCSKNSRDGPPTCSLQNFAWPKLQKCPFDFDTLNLRRSGTLASGYDGLVFGVRFGDNPTRYVLKVFWDIEPEHGYMAFQQECVNAATLQMIEAAVQDAVSGSGPPIFINPDPKTQEDAWNNLDAFVDESRGAPRAEGDLRTMEVTEMPRMRKCHGWTKLHSSTLFGWEDKERKMSPWSYRDREQKVERDLVEDDREYFGIVYEYIDEAKNDPTTVKNTADFLWRAGFAHVSVSLDRNWKSSVLIDLSDIHHPDNIGWLERRYGPRSPNEILVPDVY
ncbi:hypothetical protein F5Y18DRAFT_440631 [Xylariaceae sp. FL1019]|nr:hypothetical protein F5Y18DRAFT_440631 [Xylariaceae sp. FL1019]